MSVCVCQCVPKKAHKRQAY